MSLIQQLKLVRREFKFQFNKQNFNLNPVFLIGCGRSGTTILGNTIGKHPAIKYLNERRDLWHQVYPELDIWSGKVPNPKIIVNEKFSTPNQASRIRKAYYKEQVLDEAQILLEKLPINNFRLDFINTVFPDAKYIYLHRNGLEVAASIEKMANEGRWFRNEGFKWNFINSLMSQNTSISKKYFTNFEKGLLEWRFSVDFSEQFFSKLPQEKYFSISYDSFINNPTEQLKGIYQFLGLKISIEDINEYSNNIHRKSNRIEEIEEKFKLIGGERLEKSVTNTIRENSLTNHS